MKNGTGEYLQDPEVNARVIAAVREEGVDAWDEGRKAEFLGEAYNPDDYEMVGDILDVWFDLGCTHAFTLEAGAGRRSNGPPGSLSGGRDQHRGWFQSSLLESCATRGRALRPGADTWLHHGERRPQNGRRASAIRSIR